MCNILSISNMRKVKGLIRKFPKPKMGPPCHSFLSPSFSSFLHPHHLPFLVSAKREERTRESERERERDTAPVTVLPEI